MIIKPDLNFKIPVVKFLLPQNIFFISQKEKKKTILLETKIHMRMPHHENPVSITLKDHVIPLSPTRFYYYLSPKMIPFRCLKTYSDRARFDQLAVLLLPPPHNLKNL